MSTKRDPTTDGLRPPGLPNVTLARAGVLLTAVMLAGTGFAVLEAGATSADDSSVPRAPTPSFTEAFREVDRVALEEGDTALVAETRSLALSPDGRMAVVDPQSNTVRVYDRRGKLLGTVGGGGHGPGELKTPLDAAFDDRGRLYVAELGNARVSRFGRGLGFEEAIPVRDAQFPASVAASDGRLLAYVSRSVPGAESMRVYTPDGDLEGSFHPRRREYREVPYWSAAGKQLLAASRSWVVAGGNLLYPLVLYDTSGAVVDSVGTPPGSWVQPPRLERGAFTPPNQMKKFQRWRRTFTTIHRIAIYRDSLLVVAHQRLDPEILAYEEAAYRADVYRLPSGEKLVEDVELPGRLLGGGEHLHLLLGQPPGPWTVGRYRVTAQGVEP